MLVLTPLWSTVQVPFSTSSIHSLELRQVERNDRVHMDSVSYSLWLVERCQQNRRRGYHLPRPCRGRCRGCLASDCELAKRPALVKHGALRSSGYDAFSRKNERWCRVQVLPTMSQSQRMGGFRGVESAKRGWNKIGDSRSDVFEQRCPCPREKLSCKRRQPEFVEQVR